MRCAPIRNLTALAAVALLAAACTSTTADSEDTESGPVLVQAAAAEQAATYRSPFAGNHDGGLDSCAIVSVAVVAETLGTELDGAAHTPVGTIAACTVGSEDQVVATFEDPNHRGALAGSLPGSSTGSAYGDVLAEAEFLGATLVTGPWDAAFVSRDEPVAGSVHTELAVGDYVVRMTVTGVDATDAQFVELAGAVARGLGGYDVMDAETDETLEASDEPVAVATTAAPVTGDTPPADVATGETWCVEGVRTALNVRQDPAGALVTSIPVGQCNVQLVEGVAPVDASGHTWVNITVGSESGWVSDRYLVPCGEEDGCPGS